jgi:hypothetical protein
MTKNSLFIGISALASSGKDTFFKLFKEELKNYDVRRYALADELKIDLSGFILQKCGINIFNCSAQEKELIRPLLVEYGAIKRIQTEGKHWYEFLEKKILSDAPDIAIVTDIRYDSYKQDEAWWIKDKLGGILVHLRRYTLVEQDYGKFFSNKKGLVKSFIEAPNHHEAENDPKLYEKANYRIEWPTVGDNKLEELRPFITDFISWLKDKGFLNK